MDKKRLVKTLPPEEMKGFEEFIEGEPDEKSFLGKATGSGTKKEVGFENFTFLSNDAERLHRIKDLFSEKLPFATKYKQGEHILRNQQNAIQELRKRLFELSDKEGSPYRISLTEIFDSFFKS